MHPGMRDGCPRSGVSERERERKIRGFEEGLLRAVFLVRANVAACYVRSMLCMRYQDDWVWREGWSGDPSPGLVLGDLSSTGAKFWVPEEKIIQFLNT